MAVMENEQSKLFGVLEKFGNIFCLNVLFIIFSLPIITIGASVTATYSVMLRLVRNEEGPILKSFVKSFKKNFKASTIVWLLILLASFVIYGELLFIVNTEGALSIVYSFIVIIELVLIMFTLPFLFPLLARYDNGIFLTIKNAFLISVSNFGAWLKISLAWIMPTLICVMYPGIFLYIWYLWVLLVFGLIFFGTSFTIRKTFDKITKAVDEKAEEKEQTIVSNKKPVYTKKSISEHLNAFKKDDKS